VSIRVQIKRAYEQPSDDDGYRVLVDRIWPRGLGKDEFEYDLWCKDLAPSKELRQWFGHAPERWNEFCRRYKNELAAEEAQQRVQEVLRQAASKTITLLYGARDTEHNHAIVLAEELARQAKARARRDA